MKKMSVITSLTFTLLLRGWGYSELNKLHKDSLIKRRCGNVVSIGRDNSLRVACDKLDSEFNKFFGNIKIAKDEHKKNIKNKFVGDERQKEIDQLR